MVEKISELRKICVKHMSKEVLAMRPWYTEKVTRKVSIYITWVLLHTAISANQISGIMVLTGVAAAIFFLLGTPWFVLVGALLLQLEYLLDNVDGEIARYRQSSSLTGSYIDGLCHYFIEPLIFIAIGVGLYGRTHSLLIFIASIMAAYFLVLLKIIYDLKGKYILNHLIKNKGQSNNNLQSPEENKNSKLSITARFIRLYSLNPSRILVVNLAALLDLLIIEFGVIDCGGVGVLYLLMVSYAIFYPLHCIISLRNIILNKSVDSDYVNLTST
jgi:phosphatidylglycerophosphate synthase